ncbi:MAG TPA: methyltransferase domain-containing protein [Polyangiales bacterium]|nr:methyltransferase domain-containing protein [Polyangiales bacterium]
MMNQDQIAFWNGAGGDRWVQQQVVLDRALAPFGAAALALAAAQSGERVLDVGCGCGDTALALAEQVGPQGRVLGVDISAPMLARARERAAGISQLSFQVADAALAQFGADHDLVFSRYGVMFFEDLTVAFRNLRRALVPGGRIAFVCWRSFEENEWTRLPLEVASRVVPDAEPLRWDGPGPYAMADRELVVRVLQDSGFSGIEITRFDADVITPNVDLEEALEFVMRAGPVSRYLMNASAEQVVDARAELERVFREKGTALTGSSWLVRARA